MNVNKEVILKKCQIQIFILYCTAILWILKTKFNIRFYNFEKESVLKLIESISRKYLSKNIFLVYGTGIKL